MVLFVWRCAVFYCVVLPVIKYTVRYYGCAGCTESTNMYASVVALETPEKLVLAPGVALKGLCLPRSAVAPVTSDRPNQGKSQSGQAFSPGGPG